MNPSHPHTKMKFEELPTISFITVCMGRLHHLKKTLRQNLEDNKDYPRLEFVLLDYNSPDGMKEWVLKHCAAEIESGYLRFYRYEDAEFFHFSHSRNMALRLSTGRIICNVDADNFTGENFAFYLANNLQPGQIFTGCRINEGHLKPYMDEGVAGRLAGYRGLFHRAGGYDEEMASWGYEDLDLCERLRDMGYTLTTIDSEYLACIWHNDEERAKHVEDKNIGRDTTDSEGTCYEHEQLSIRNRSDGHYRANPKGYGLGKVKALTPGEQQLEVLPYKHRKISYCITSMNRLHHLKQTLPQNIQDNADYPNQEFLVLDYNSADGLKEWVLTEMREHVDTGLVKLYRTTEPAYFIKSHAMNMAFRQAEGDIIVNLDADNYTGSGFSDFVNEGFDRNEASFLMLDLKRFPDRRDAVGRIGMRREDFHRVRGYDERMDGYGWEDFDICHRLAALGLEKIFIDDRSFLNYIAHGNDERVKAGKIFRRLHQLLKYTSPEQDFYSLIFLFRDQSYMHLPDPEHGKLKGNWNKAATSLTLTESTGRQKVYAGSTEAGYASDNGTQAKLEPINDEDAINGAILWFHLSENERMMNGSIEAGKAVANQQGYGEGKVFRCTDNEPIML